MGPLADAIQHVHKDCKMQCTESFSSLLQRYARKGIDAKNLAILRFFFVMERTLTVVKYNACIVS